MQDRQLMEYFKFDESDLMINRQGKLSKKQRENLEKDSKSIKWWAGVTGGILLLITAGLLIWTVRGFITSNKIDLGSIAWGLVTGLLAYYLIRRSLGNIYDYTVKKAEGPISIRAERASRSGDLSYELQVGGKEFYIDGELQDAMSNGDIYDIYYIEDTRSNTFVLSTEYIAGKQVKE